MCENNPSKSDPIPGSTTSQTTAPKAQPKTLEKLIQEKAPEILEAIPVGQRPKLAKVIIEQTRISYRSGLLPEPTELAAYNEIIPNGADRIMIMAEAQNSHRLNLETTVVGSQQKQEERGQWFGLIIALFFGSCGLYAAINGQPWFGGVISGTTLVSLVGVFVYSKRKSQKELSDKRQSSMTPPTPVSPAQNHQKKPKKR